MHLQYFITTSKGYIFLYHQDCLSKTGAPGLARLRVGWRDPNLTYIEQSQEAYPHRYYLHNLRDEVRVRVSIVRVRVSVSVDMVRVNMVRVDMVKIKV